MGGPGRPSRLRRGRSSLLTCMWPVAPSGRATKAGSVGMRCAFERRALSLIHISEPTRLALI
eukprot:3620400-Alexandrium_andersonii.AAC.1